MYIRKDYYKHLEEFLNDNHIPYEKSKEDYLRRYHIRVPMYVEEKMWVILYHLRRALGEKFNPYIEAIKFMKKDAEIFLTYLCLLGYDITPTTKLEVISTFARYDTEDKLKRGIPLCT